MYWRAWSNLPRTRAWKPPTALPDPEWPTFHNNLPRQGISPSNFIPPINQVWTDGPHNINRWNGVIMKDGILFSAPLDGTLRARDPFTGDILWSRTLGGTNYYTSTMTAAGGVLYATFYGPSGGYVYALDEVTGNTIWVVGQANTSLDFNARNVMTYADGLVFGTTWGQQAYALRAADGTVAWTFQLDGLVIASGATINTGLAYFATVTGTVFALDEFSGALVWSHTLDNTITTTPLFAQGNLYVGTYTGTEFALDALTGATIWSTGGFSLIDASAAVYDGINIYFGDFNAAFLLRLVRTRAEMRRERDTGMFAKRMFRRQRLGGKHVQRRRRDLAGIQRRQQIIFHDDLTAGAVHEAHLRLHF